MVPEQEGKTETRHGRAEEGRRIVEAVEFAQVLLGERAEPRHSEEEVCGEQQRRNRREEHNDNGEMSNVLMMMMIVCT